MPAQRSRSQAVVHIAAHGAVGDSDDNHKHGILRLTELVAMPNCAHGLDPQCLFDGILSAESIVKSRIEWRARMVVLSACSSGEGEVCIFNLIS